MKHRILIFQLILFCTGCNYFKVEKLNRDDIKEIQLKELKEIKERDLQNYPEIGSCSTIQTSKECFEKQIIDLLGNNLKYPKPITSFKKDTIWLTIQVSKNGDMSLKPQELANEEFQKMVYKIDSTLQATSPIKPAHINGINVSCNFKLPLVINNNDF